MPLETVVDGHRYRLRGRAGFEGIVFTRSSPTTVELIGGVRFAAEQQAVLQSFREGVAFKLEARGIDNANLYHTTRTVGAYFMSGNSFYVAFDDSPVPEENPALQELPVRTLENLTTDFWLFQKNNPFIARLLERAHAANRVIQLSPTHTDAAALRNNYVLSLLPDRGVPSPFAQDPVIHALVGADLAEPYADALRKSGNQESHIHLIDSCFLPVIGVTLDAVAVRMVTLTGSKNIYITGTPGSVLGYARGVAPPSVFPKRIVE